MKHALFFDLDGTVLASERGVFNSLSYALRKLGVPIPPYEELFAFLGPPLEVGFKIVCHVPDELIAQAVAYYREYYNGGGKYEAEIYGGLRELLTACREQGKHCYITTSKPQVFARDILAHFDMADCFDAIYGSELDGTRANKAELLTYCLAEQGLTAADTVMIGDRFYDVNGAKAVGMDCVGILYGYGNEQELRNAGAAYIAKTVADLQQLLLQL